MTFLLFVTRLVSNHNKAVTKIRILVKMKNLSKQYSFVKLRTETMEKIGSLCKKREREDQIVRTYPNMVTTLVNEAYEAEIGK